MDSNNQNENQNQDGANVGSGTSSQEPLATSGAVGLVPSATPSAEQPASVEPVSPVAPASVQPVPPASSVPSADSTTPASTEAMQTDATQQAEVPKKKNKMTIWLIVAVAVLAVVGIVIGLVASGVFNNNSAPTSGGNQTNTSGNNNGTGNNTTQPQRPQEEEDLDDEEAQERANTRYKDDMAKLLTQMVQYQANNTGQLPKSNGWEKFLESYMRTSGDSFDDMATGNPYKIKAFESVDDLDPSKLDEIPTDEFYVIYNATCDGDSVVISDKEQEITLVHSNVTGTAHFCMNL